MCKLINRNFQFLIVIFILCMAKISTASVSDSIDILHTTIRLNITNYVSKVISGNAEIQLTAKVDNINSIPLDLQKLTVDSVKSGETSLTFEYNDTLLLVHLPAIINTGDTSVITVYYHGSPDKDGSWGGWYWTGNYSFQLGVGFDSDPHNFGRIWFPCFDNFTERCTFRYEIITTNDYKAVCGGVLESEIDNGDSTTLWIWNCNQTIPSYLASVAVSTYETVHMTYNGIMETIPIELAANAADTTNLKNSFIHLIDALSIFENAYGPYQWDRVGFVAVPFNGGAMEHAMNIAYPLFAVTGTTVWEDLMAHELSHHWWGNLITCADEKEMWLNEGWAEYSAHLFKENLYGEQAYRDVVDANHLEIINYGFANDGGNYFALAEMPHDYTYGFTTYNKGAMVAHNLRGYMGDEMFFECITGFLSDHAFQAVTSEQFRDYLSTCSGTDMTPFFDGWVFNPGMPAFEFQSTGYSHMIGLFDVCIQQKLNHAPEFFNAVPLELSWVNNDGEELNTETIIMNGEYFELSIGTPVFEEANLIIDRQNKIADAVTAEEFFLTDIGIYDSGLGKMIFKVNALDADTTWMRIEHYWVAADGFRTPVTGLHVNSQRYWRIIGGFNGDNISATLKFNGTANTSGGYLDDEFISNSDDSLVLLYRSDPQEEWSIYSYYELNTWGVSTDKRGAFELDKLLPGEYAIGIYNNALPTAELDTNYCAWLSTDISETVQPYNWKLYPNPANNTLTIENYNINQQGDLRIYDCNGILIFMQSLSGMDSHFTIDTSKFPQGLYNVCVTTNGALSAGQKLLIIR
ncbi:MAG: T9SS type A sorting domain-containing protein [Chitinophagales bacterium]|nr:T9SS type A sorting domain-containing protein [Bacteroidota bacterium]MBP7400262.1 T9SS type A sorting domain-containing protein [Chitinophagales bacterium]MBP8753357.1 T9SS type A sorting domain-containing protein [Chitinophagales bacterium]MBP9189540.1 T9SS type A sorting domain-containing protein [Chitinophagales bacterium]MBP9549079.1 T9SS type A sorting domain-containing protein [Chitinophagales bacterium]